jgi:hypothetical protein
MAFEADCGVWAVLLTPCVATTVGYLLPTKCMSFSEPAVGAPT